MADGVEQRAKYLNPRTGKWRDGPCGRNCGFVGPKGKMYSYEHIAESICSKCHKVEQYKRSISSELEM